RPASTPSVIATDTETRLRALLARRIVILDGAMGTMIQQLRLTEEQFRGLDRTQRFASHPVDLRGNNDLLSLTRPEGAEKINADFLDAGADIIETNTFGASRIAQEDYKLGDIAYDLNVAAARVARAAVDKVTTAERPRFVAGAMGPTPRTASISPDVNDPG